MFGHFIDYKVVLQVSYLHSNVATHLQRDLNNLSDFVHNVIHTQLCINLYIILISFKISFKYGRIFHVSYN